MTTAIIGVGNIGKAVARHLVNGGERVVLAARDESNATALANELGELASATSVEKAITDADVVLFIYREEYYLGRAEPRPNTPEHFEWQEKMNRVTGVAEVIIGKQRHGPTGIVELQFDASLTKFQDLIKPDYLPEQIQ